MANSFYGNGASNNNGEFLKLLRQHQQNQNIHVTIEQKTKWNKKMQVIFDDDYTLTFKKG